MSSSVGMTALPLVVALVGVLVTVHRLRQKSAMQHPNFATTSGASENQPQPANATPPTTTMVTPPKMPTLQRQPSVSTSDLRIFTDAVGGHTSKQRGPAMLTGSGLLLKPFQDAGENAAEEDDGNGGKKRKKKLRGEMEAEFYARVWASEHPLKIHQPKYFGVETLEDGTKYLVLEDLTFGLAQPCVLDLKMGRRSYDEDATPDKIAKEKAKYPPQEVVGFRFSGMRVYQPATGDWVQSTREWCFSLEPAQIPDALERFFFDGRSVRRPLIRSMLEQVGSIAKCLEEFPTWRMYGASLLILYDGASPDSTVIARLIDFSHCYEIKDDGGKDYGFLHGLYFLLSSLNDILDRGRRNLTRRGSLVDSATRIIVQTSERSLEEASEGSGTPQQQHASLSASSSLVEVPAAAAAETLEIFQHDPHLAPVVRKKFNIAGESAVASDQYRKSKRRSKSMHDVLLQASLSEGGGSATSSPSTPPSHQRSPSTNDAMMPSRANSSPMSGGGGEGFVLPPAPLPTSKRSKSVESNVSLSSQEELDTSTAVLDSSSFLPPPSTSTQDGGDAAPRSCPPGTIPSIKSQVGGAHDNIYVSEGTVEKEEVDKEHFESEVRFYLSIADDALNRVVPAFIRVDDVSVPRRLILEDIAALVAQPLPAAQEMDDIRASDRSLIVHANEAASMVNVMDIKLGVRSFRADVSNEAKSTYFEKYLECIADMTLERRREVWTQLVGNPEGPSELAKRKLGKKDYLLFRDGTTTSAQYGFRLTALKHFDFEVTQEEAKTKVDSYAAFLSIFEHFLSSGPNGFDSELAANFIQEIDSILEAIKASKVYENSDFVGSSLLFVHQGGVPAIRWIDFANVTSPVSEDGNGIVFGIKKLRSILDDLIHEPQLAI